MDIQSFSSDLSKEETLSKIYDVITAKWKTSFNYTERDPIVFESKPVSGEIINHSDFQRIAFYISNLYASISSTNAQFIENERVLSEVAHWDEEGALCIYLSVVLYELLVDAKVVSEDDLKLIQGYTQYEPTNPFYKLLASNSLVLTNFHVWVSYKGSVLDFSIGQESMNIRLENNFVIGDLPEGIAYIGLEESKSTIDYYSELFATNLHMDKKEWLLEHKIASLKTMLAGLESI